MTSETTQTTQPWEYLHDFLSKEIKKVTPDMYETLKKGLKK